MDHIETSPSGESFKINRVSLKTFKTPVDPKSIRTFLGDSKFCAYHSGHVHKSRIIPMPCHASIMLAALAPVQSWHPKNSDALEILSMVFGIIYYHAINSETLFYQQNAKRVKNARIKLVESQEKMDVKMREDFDKVDGPESFVSFMIHYTYERLAIYDTCLQEMFNIPFLMHIPRTPVKLDRPRYAKVYQHFFQMKEAILHTELEMTHEEGTYEKKAFFGISDIPRRIEQDPLVADVIDATTAREYYSLLKG
jgi:hypothetical protein